MVWNKEQNRDHQEQVFSDSNSKRERFRDAECLILASFKIYNLSKSRSVLRVGTRNRIEISKSRFSLIIIEKERCFYLFVFTQNKSCSYVM